MAKNKFKWNKLSSAKRSYYIYGIILISFIIWMAFIDSHSLIIHTELNKEIRKLVDEGYNQAKKILTEKIDDLHKIAKALITYETLTGEEIENIINKNLYPKDKILENQDSKDDHDSALGAMGLKPKIVH